jgi:hypothetical protein
MVVGACGYEFHPALQYAASDATDFAHKLVAKLGFDRERMLVLADAPGAADYRPTRRDIFHSLGLLGDTNSEFYRDSQLEPMGQDDLFVFYFSGHGLRRERTEFLLPVETSHYSVTETAVSLEAIVERIEALPCPHKILFIDACREQLYHEEGAKAAVAGAKGIGERNVVDRQGLATFYSCDPGQRSYEIDDLHHGSFTYCLLEAIDHPQINTLGELDGFLKSRVPQENQKGKKGLQQPFLVPNPTDMLELGLFQIADVQTELEQLVAMTTNLTTRGLLDEDWWERLCTVWEADDPPNFGLKRSVFEKLYREELSFEEFERKWQRTETSLPILSSQPHLPTPDAGKPHAGTEPGGLGATVAADDSDEGR